MVRAYAFISHVEENKGIVDRLAEDLQLRGGVEVWLNRDHIAPAQYWEGTLNDAIQNGAFFIACLSRESYGNHETQMYDELLFAIDRLKRLPKRREWFIPVLINETEIPKYRISEQETLKDISAVKLYTSWEQGLKTILQTMNLNERDYHRTLWRALSWLFSFAGWLLVATGVYSLCRLGTAWHLLLVLMREVIYWDWPRNAPPAVGYLIGDIINPFVFGVSGSALVVFGKRASLKAKLFGAADSRRPVIYLRSFASDKEMARRPLLLGRFFTIKSEEEQLVEALQDIGPVFAIGKPREPLPILGALRLYFDDEEWRCQVLDWFSRAALIVICLPLEPSAGVLWEISSGLSYVERERLIFLMPRDGHKNLSWLNEVLQNHHIRPLIIKSTIRMLYGSSVSGVVYFSSDEASFVPLIKPPFWHRGYSCPLIRVYRLALAPINEQRVLPE